MKNNIFILLIFTTICCKNDVDTVAIKNKKDVSILYYKNNGVKDSIASIIFNLGMDEISKSQFGNALAKFHKADSIEPNNLAIINALGNTLYSLNDSEKAYEYFYKAINIDSTFSNTYLNLGFTYNTNKQRKKAIEVLKKGLSFEHDKENKGYFNYNIANALFKLGKYEESESYNNTALELVKNQVMRKNIYELKEAIKINQKNN